MVRQLPEEAIGRHVGTRLEGVADAPMQADPARRAHLLEQRAADDAWENT